MLKGFPDPDWELAEIESELVVGGDGGWWGWVVMVGGDGGWWWWVSK